MLRHAIILLGCQAGLAFADVQSWNAQHEFSIENGNPNGVWSYGWMPVDFSEFRLLEHPVWNGSGPQWAGWNGDGTPGIWRNDSQGYSYGIPPGWLSLHPGPGTEPSVLRWTAPVGGSYLIAGVFGPGDAGWIQVAVRVDGVTVWAAPNEGVFSVKAYVPAGGTVDFMAYGGYGFGNTALTADIGVGCTADFNRDGFVDFFDYDDFVVAFEAGDPASDANDDGFLDFFDYDAFVLSFETGC